MTFRDFSNIKLVELFVAFLLCARFQGITAAPTVDLGVTLEDGTAAMFVRDWQALSTDFGVVGSGLDKRDGQYEKRQQASTTKPVPTPPPFPGYPSITVPPKEGILFKNARVFDGLQVRPKLDILVVGNTIQNVSQASLTAPAGARVVDLANSNRTIIPGLIDSHVHVLLNKPVATLLSASDWQLGVWAAKQLQDMLMRGFTTVRDAAGADGTIAAMVVAGDVIGPRVFPSGTIISQTSGHADFFSPYPQDDTEAVFTMTPKSNKNLLTVADGADATLQAARLNLKRKATQIKLAAGGGASSLYDPLHTTQSTPEEMQAAVRAAKNWGTYVMVHAYQTESIKMAIDKYVSLCENDKRFKFGSPVCFWFISAAACNSFATDNSRTKRRLCSSKRRTLAGNPKPSRFGFLPTPTLARAPTS